MVFSTRRALCTVPLLLSSLAGSSQAAAVKRQEESLDQWLTTQDTFALQSILDNIGPNGRKVKGAHAGIVVASPSRSDPPCMTPPYSWMLELLWIFHGIYTCSQALR